MTDKPSQKPGMITVSALNRLAGVRHAFFTREGGYSEGGYGSLNCGLASGDDREKVEANRALAAAQLDLPPESLAAVQQIHGNAVAVVGDDWQPRHRPPADGLVSRRRGIALGVLGADCAPVLFADAEAGVIGAAHAGWRGALAGIVDNTVKEMIALGARPENMVAAIGPCIAQGSYEVGPEFPQLFLAEHAANAVFFTPSDKPGHFRFDLPGYIAQRLNRSSIGTVTRTPCDTFRQEDRFFSYRRSQLAGEEACGRQLSAIALGAER